METDPRVFISSSAWKTNSPQVNRFISCGDKSGRTDSPGFSAVRGTLAELPYLICSPVE